MATKTKKRRLKRRYTKKGKPTKAMKKWQKNPLRRYYYKKAKTKTGRLWKFVKRISKKEKGRKDILMPSNPTYQQANIRSFLSVTELAVINCPYRKLSKMIMSQHYGDVGQVTSPTFTATSSDVSIINGIGDGHLGYFTGYMLQIYPKQGTAVNEISGNEFFLDSINFNFLVHYNVTDSNSWKSSATYFDSKPRGGSVTWYLIIEPTIGQGTEFAKDTIYTRVFDNTYNWSDATLSANYAQLTTAKNMRADYYQKKRNLNLSKRVKIVKLIRVDYGATNAAFASLSNGTNDTMNENHAIYWRYDGNTDMMKKFNVSVKIKKKLSMIQTVIPQNTTHANTAWENAQNANTNGKSYNFWLLGCTSALYDNTNLQGYESRINIQMQCESIFHDV